jgi:hypothetical protein
LAVLLLAAKLGASWSSDWASRRCCELLIRIGLANLLPLILGEPGIAFVRSEPTLRILAEAGVLRSGQPA